MQKLVGAFREVPPPDEAPIQSEAETLGLMRGIRVEPSRGGQWRCSCCGKMQPEGSMQAWVPDSVSKHDSEEDIIEACRNNAYNGHYSGWCLGCAPKSKKQ